MAITRAWVTDDCIGCGNSELYYPELFKLDLNVGKATVIIGVDLAAIEDKIKEAAEACPVGAIKYEVKEK